MTQYYMLILFLPTPGVGLPWGSLVGQNKPPSSNKEVEVEGETVKMVDAMVQMMEGEGEFDRTFLSKLSTCMDTISPDLWAASNGAWAGLVEYHDSGGVGNDTWGSCLG